METRQLGNSDLRITPVGIGAWAMGGGGWKFAWGPQDDNASIAAIHKALDYGVNWIDTAAVYGFGHSEEVVARALDGLTPKPYIFTKCSRVWDDKGDIEGILKRSSVRRECEASLRRLKVDVIDLYQIHWGLPDEDIEEGWSAMAELKREGKVQHIGVSNFSASQLRRAQAIAPVASIQPPYSLLAREAEVELLPYALQTGVGAIVYSPMKMGLLSGKMTRERVAAFPADDNRRNRPDFQEPLLTRNLEFAEFLRGVGARHGRTPGEVAIAWTLRNPAVTAAIVGMRSAEQVEGVIHAGWFRLSDDETREIESFFAQHTAEAKARV
jgi:aryl-alcohol dehydrogenase-like predicted oxidoreductase